MRKAQGVFYSILVVALFCFTACDNDSTDELTTGFSDDTTANLFEVEGNKYQTPLGLLDYYGNSEDNHDNNLYSLKLFSNHAESNRETANYDCMISFKVCSPELKDLGSGTYNCIAQDSDLTNAYSFSEGQCMLETETDGRQSIQLVSGTLDVKKENEMYILTYSCLDENGNSVKGYFKGALLFYNASQK